MTPHKTLQVTDKTQREDDLESSPRPPTYKTGFLFSKMALSCDFCQFKINHLILHEALDIFISICMMYMDHKTRGFMCSVLFHQHEHSNASCHGSGRSPPTHTACFLVLLLLQFGHREGWKAADLHISVHFWGLKTFLPHPVEKGRLLGNRVRRCGTARAHQAGSSGVCLWLRG